MKPSPKQDEALKAVDRWFNDKNSPPFFYLGGYAGTGKSSLAKHFADNIDGLVLYGAFTGKAALVMQTKGCENASTIHSMIYNIIEQENAPPRFIRNKDSEVKDAELVIIDEVSMVDEDLGRDLLSFGTKVLVLGDPFQLPPVGGPGYFTYGDPDFMLTEIHRQAEDNPIIHMSMLVREGKKLPLGTYGESAVIPREDVTQEIVLGADQVLVGTNRTRYAYNRRIRELLQRPESVTEGDRVICLRNVRDKGLLNGSLWNVREVVKKPTKRKKIMKLLVDPLDAGMIKRSVEVRIHEYFFQGRDKELEWNQLKGLDQFDFGYAITCHKAQGSQWDNVVTFNESGAFRDDAPRWLYTAITRAAEKTTVVMP